MRNLLVTLIACAAAWGSFAGDSRPIGVCDSGIGGFTVLEKLMAHPGLKGERFTYLGDQANMPYGNYDAAGKSAYLRELAIKDALFLVSDGYYVNGAEAEPTGIKDPAKIVVIACNTATAYGRDAADAVFKCVGARQKVIGVINAGVRSTLRGLQAEKAKEPFAVGVMATPGTIASGAYARTIRRELKARGVTAEMPVVDQGCAGLADAVEAGSPAADAIAHSNLCALVARHRASGSSAPLRAVILGCTHYPFVLSALNRAVSDLRARGESLPPDFRFVDPARYTAAECYRLLREAGRLSASSSPGPSMAFLSVANPDLPPSLLTADGRLTRAFKYGRSVGSREITTKPIPFTRAAFGDAVFADIARLLPRTAALLDSQEVPK